MNRTINYIGWLGHKNLGDEALFIVNQQIFNKFYLIHKHQLYNSPVSLFGGGTVLPEWAYDIQINKYNYAFGVGVKDPTHMGNYRQYFIKSIKLFNFRALGVRGYKSQEVLQGWGIDSEVIGDPVLSLQPKEYNNSDSEYAIINAGISNEKIWGDTNIVQIQLINVIKKLKKKGYKVIILPFWDKDVLYCKELAIAAGAELIETWDSVEKTLEVISKARLLVGIKLHSLVFSAACYIPFISLEYLPKCYDFSHSLSFDNYNLRIDEIETNKVIDLAEDIEKNRSKLIAELKNKVTKFRNKQLIFANNIITDIENIPIEEFKTTHKYIHYLSEKARKKLMRLQYYK